MRRPIFLLALVVGLVAASVIAIALKPTVLGLDLQGGVEVVLQGKPTEQAQVTEEAIDRSVEIIRDRVDALRRRRARDPDPGRRPDRRRAAGRRGPGAGQRPHQPGAAHVHPVRGQRRQPGRDREPLRRGEARRADGAGGGARPPSFYAFDRQSKELWRAPSRPRDAARGVPEQPHPAERRGREVPRGSSSPSRRANASRRGSPAPSSAGTFSRATRPHRPGRQLGERLLETQGIGGNRWIVTMSFTGDGREKFQDLTRQLAVEGNLKGQLSASSSTARSSRTRPSTTTTTRRGSTAQRRPDRGDFSQDEAQTLATWINLERLLIEREVIEQGGLAPRRGVARPGADRRDRRPGPRDPVLIGYYRFLGVIAALGLIVYAILLYAIVVLVPIFTLPGIAWDHPHDRRRVGRQRDHLRRVREEARSKTSRGPRSSPATGGLAPSSTRTS